MAFFTQEPAATENQDSVICTESFLPPQRVPRRGEAARIWISRTTVILPPRPPPAFSLPTVKRFLFPIPWKWCADNRLRIRDIYLSRDPFLKKMSQRFIVLRGLQSKETKGQRIIQPGVEFLGLAMDYFLTIPLKRLPCPSEAVVNAWATGPVKSTRDTMNRHPGWRQESIDGLPFPWVTNSTGTKMVTLDRILISGDKLTGFVECEKCGSFFGIGYLPNRIIDAVAYIATKGAQIIDNADHVLSRSFGFKCSCDGNPNPVSPFISDNFRKINWMCLLTGFGIEYCTMDQLMFYCKERKLETWGHRNFLILRVCADISEQVSGRQSPNSQFKSRPFHVSIV